MGKHAYVVWYYNGEKYDEDVIERVERVFDSWEKAEEYLNKQDGFSKNMKRTFVFDIDERKNIYINKPMWENKEENEYDEYWIEIFDVVTGKKVLYDNKHILYEGDRRSPR